jgi:hypothetical protein
MTSVLQQFPDSSFPTIYCTRIVVNPETTNFKWNPARKHPAIQILGIIDTVKSVSLGGPHGVLAATGYTLGGTNCMKWYFKINEPVIMHMGLAEDSQDTSSPIGVLFDYNVAVNKGDKVRFSLDGVKLSIQHESAARAIVFNKIYDLTIHFGKKVYPWVSTVANDTISVKIFEDVEFVLKVRTDGKVVMTGSSNDVVDFSVNDIVDNSPGEGGGVIGVSSKIENAIGGASVETKDDGGIYHIGGMRFDCDKIIAPTVNVVLGLNQHSIVIQNVATTSVTLPPATTTTDCMKYAIIRNYVQQVGETWQNPALKVYGSGGDTIDGETWIGVPPNTGISVISYATDKWRIL